MKIGLLGMGTIGSGVYEQLADREDISVKRILDKRIIPGVESLLTADFSDILNDPEIDTVVELMGGIEPAHTFVLRAMNAGKNVVSANKLMIAHNLPELVETAAARGVDFRYSASVGGSIPYLINILRARRADRLTKVEGIVNGTTNLILDTMQTTGEAFDEVLRQAQRAAYAEADPSSDIDGIDARSKICIAASLAFDAAVRPEDVAMAGIRNVRAEDMELFKRRGLVCRLIAGAERLSGEMLAAYVEPTLVSPRSPYAAVTRNDNLISVTGRRFGSQSYSGQGAGKTPTAYAVVQDLLDVMGSSALLPFVTKLMPLTVDNDQLIRRYYLRTRASRAPEGEMLMVRGDTSARITNPTTVKAMHETLSRLLKEDPESFMAAVAE